LQGGLVGVATALSPATCRPFQVFSPSFFVGLKFTVVNLSDVDAVDAGITLYICDECKFAKNQQGSGG
jgi:hypothetical protein